MPNQFKYAIFFCLIISFKGKTTLADNLLSYNKIIPNEAIGSAMFMDFRQDEKERQITMKASCFSCLFVNPLEKIPYIINFIDSPGHVDFVHEISTAVNLADSGLIVVDVVEGVCSQVLFKSKYFKLCSYI